MKKFITLVALLFVSNSIYPMDQKIKKISQIIKKPFIFLGLLFFVSTVYCGKIKIYYGTIKIKQSHKKSRKLQKNKESKKNKKQNKLLYYSLPNDETLKSYGLRPKKKSRV